MKLVLAVILLSASSIASAQVYVGAGGSILKLQAQGIVEDKTIGMLTVGYKTRWFAGEAFCGGSTDCGAAALGHVPVGDVMSFFGRLSVRHMKGEATETTLINTNAPGDGPGGFGTFSSRTASWSGWTPGLGAGLQFARPGGGLGGRVLLEQTRSVGQLDRARLFSVSLLYSF